VSGSDAATAPTTVAEVLDRALRLDPGREAVVARSGRLTYGELDAAANRAAQALAGFGVRQGDRVAASLPNDLDVVVLFHAVQRLGAVWVGVNLTLAPPEKAYILRDCEVSLLLATPAVAESLAPSVAAGELPALRRTLLVDPSDPGSEWAQACAAAPAEAVGVAVDPYAPAGIAYTSGTTGFPKGVVQSQYNLLLPGRVVVADRGYGPDLVKGDAFAFTILNLQVLSTLLVAQAAGRIVVIDRSDHTGITEWIEAEQVELWNGAPATLHSMAHDPAITPERLASLREVWSGGGDLPEATYAAFSAKFAAPVHTTYGLTEAPTLVTIQPRNSPHVPGTSGVALPHLAVDVVDDDGRPLPTGETGEVVVGPVTEGPWAGAYRPMLGYWNRPEATEEALRGGVLHTGDLGALDEEGRLVIRDRKNLLIIRGGANVYPAEVERVLVAVPGVAGAAVTGVPDERLGERVVALVELAAGASVTADDLDRHCRANLARYKVPERFTFVEQLPRNAMGKVDRKALAPFLG